MSPPEELDIESLDPPLFADQETVADADLAGALEAVLLVVDSPVTESALATAVGHGPERVLVELTALADRYTTAGSGIELRQVGGGWRFYTRDRFAPVVEGWVDVSVGSGPAGLRSAWLEVLAGGVPPRVGHVIQL